MQLLYLPGIIEGAEDGKGKGRQVINVARTFNLILVVLDAVQPLTYKGLIPDKNRMFKNIFYKFSGWGLFHWIFWVQKIFLGGSYNISNQIFYSEFIRNDKQQINQSQIFKNSNRSDSISKGKI